MEKKINELFDELTLTDMELETAKLAQQGLVNAIESGLESRVTVPTVTLEEVLAMSKLILKQIEAAGKQFEVTIKKVDEMARQRAEEMARQGVSRE